MTSHLKPCPAILLGTVLLSLFISATHIQAQRELGQLRVKDTNWFASYGSSVAISGNRVIVGAPNDATPGNYTGSAHIFRRDARGNWAREARLLAPKGAVHDVFGVSVAIDGNLAVVGAPARLSKTRGGRIHIFRFDGKSWKHEAEFVRGAWLGSSVAVQGNRVVAGAPWTRLPKLNWNGPNHGGAAWVFRYSGNAWTEEAMLKASDPDINDYFGSSVAIDGTEILVGAPGEGDNFAARYSIGAVYAFQQSGSSWSQTQKIRALKYADQASFGASIAMSKGRAIVGSPGKKVRGIWGAGAAYLLLRTTTAWVEERKLSSPWPGTSTSFGARVALDAGIALVGHQGRDAEGNTRGAVHVYRHGPKGWQDEPVFRPRSLSKQEGFGIGLAVQGGLAAIGANAKSTSTFSAGSVFLEDLSPSFHFWVKPLPLQTKDTPRFEIRSAKPGAALLLFFSFQGKTSLRLPWPGAELRLASPLWIAATLADKKGLGGWDIPIPASALGIKVWMQAFEIQSLQVLRSSNLVYSQIRLPL